MRRFFIPRDVVQGEQIFITGELAHRISRVVRLSSGDRVVLFNGSGIDMVARLDSVSKNRVSATISSHVTSITEPDLSITLYQGLIKGDKFEWVLQKGTELGISRFVPIICERTIPSVTFTESDPKIKRWRKILVESAEQCGRSVVPILSSPIDFVSACRGLDPDSLAIMPWESAQGCSLRRVIGANQGKKTSVFIGPEGGFQTEEVEFAKTCGILPVSLGPRIFRSETAGIVVTAALMYESNELEG